jgi:dihydroorotate dehydrogenase
VTYRLLRQTLFLVDPERIHTWVFALLRLATWPGFARRLLRTSLAPTDPRLASTVWGVRFPGPLGLAAGFDKDGHGLQTWGALGFGYAEVGTVTAQAQPGNPMPRLFRLAQDRALLNRMGFNNHGAGALALQLTRHTPDVPIGVNIGKTKVTPAEGAVEDYAESARLVGPLASYLVVNVSSPNTPGLRDLQAVSSLRPILAAVRAATCTPLLVKIAPDLSDSDIDEIADLAVELGLAGIVATNTTVSRAGLLTPDVEELGSGGVSGAPVAARSLEVLAGRGPARADQRRRHRDRRRRLGAHHLRRLTTAGLHRIHLWRRPVGQADPRRNRPAVARGRIRHAHRGGRRRDPMNGYFCS